MIMVLGVLLGTMLITDTVLAWPGQIVVVRRGVFGRQRVVVQRGFNHGFNRGFNRSFNRGFNRGIGVSAFGTNVFVGPRFRSNRVFFRQSPFFFQQSPFFFQQPQIIIQSNGGFFH